MDSFIEALYGNSKRSIPEEYDWFAPLLGDWDFDYYDGGPDARRHVVGEWLFRRILNGAGIEDLFICPSRATVETNPQPDGEYGLAIRMFNSDTNVYDMVYTCKQRSTHLTFQKENDRLIGTVVNRPEEKWIFSDIREQTFHWQNVTVEPNGQLRVNADVYARRRNAETDSGYQL